MTKGKAPKPIHPLIIAAFFLALVAGMTAQYWDPFTK